MIRRILRRAVRYYYSYLDYKQPLLTQLVPVLAKQFETVECPLHLENIRLPARGTVLLEDLGNLTANELYDPAGAGENAASAILEGLDQLAGQCAHLIVVSNEVFSGGADYAGDTGRYLKALAQVNNALAARADHVVRVVCGIPVYYKGVEK